MDSARSGFSVPEWGNMSRFYKESRHLISDLRHWFSLFFSALACWPMGRDAIYPFWCPSLGINAHLSCGHSLCNPRPWRYNTITGLGYHTLGNEACSHCCEESQTESLFCVMASGIFFFTCKEVPSAISLFADLAFCPSACWCKTREPSDWNGFQEAGFYKLPGKTAPTLVQGKEIHSCLERFSRRVIPQPCLPSKM